MTNLMGWMGCYVCGGVASATDRLCASCRRSAKNAKTVASTRGAHGAPRLTDEQRETIRKMTSQFKSVRKIATATGLSETCVRNYQRGRRG